MSKLETFTKLRKQHCISISVFSQDNREKHKIHTSKNTFKRHADLLLVENKDKSHYVLLEHSQK